MKRILILIVVFASLAQLSLAQELKCNVQVLTPQIQSSDKRIFTTLQTSIIEFMNNRRWTQDVYQNNERIECTLIINITEAISVDEFKATAQILSTRPIYGTNYNTGIFNFSDADWQFKYVENEPLEFSETGNNSILSSLLAYYAFITLGYDYDSYQLYGGTPWFTKAQTIVNNSQNQPTKGWKAFENSRNRYWIVENMLNPIYKPMRQITYDYHIKCLDIMATNPDNARTVAKDCLPLLQRIYREKANAICMKLFFTAKNQELVNLFSKSAPNDKQKIVADLSQVDPANITRYQAIMKGN